MSKKTFSTRLPIQSRIALQEVQRFYFQRYGIAGVITPLSITQCGEDGHTEVGIVYGNQILTRVMVSTEVGEFHNIHHVLEFYDSGSGGWYRPVIGPDGDVHYAPRK